MAGALFRRIGGEHGAVRAMGEPKTRVDWVTPGSTLGSSPWTTTAPPGTSSAGRRSPGTPPRSRPAGPPRRSRPAALLADFVRQAAERGLPPAVLCAPASFDGRVDLPHPTARLVSEDEPLGRRRRRTARYYVLTVPSSLRARFAGADVSAQRAPAGGRRGRRRRRDHAAGAAAAAPARRGSHLAVIRGTPPTRRRPRPVARPAPADSLAGSPRTGRRRPAAAAWRSSRRLAAAAAGRSARPAGSRRQRAATVPCPKPKVKPPAERPARPVPPADDPVLRAVGGDELATNGLIVPRRRAEAAGADRDHLAGRRPGHRRGARRLRPARLRHPGQRAEDCCWRRPCCRKLDPKQDDHDHRRATWPSSRAARRSAWSRAANTASPRCGWACCSTPATTRPTRWPGSAAARTGWPARSRR